jgi:hypothetical protein
VACNTTATIDRSTPRCAAWIRASTLSPTPAEPNLGGGGEEQFLGALIVLGPQRQGQEVLEGLLPHPAPHARGVGAVREEVQRAGGLLDLARHARAVAAPAGVAVPLHRDACQWGARRVRLRLRGWSRPEKVDVAFLLYTSTPLACGTESNGERGQASLSLTDAEDVRGVGDLGVEAEQFAPADHGAAVDQAAPHPAHVAELVQLRVPQV